MMNPSYRRIEDLHQKIERELAHLNLHPEPVNLYAPLKYSIASGGKRFRPLLLLLTSELFNGNTLNKANAEAKDKEKKRGNPSSPYPLPSPDSLNAAIAIELFHNFTLIHDDIMDNAPLRRKKQTVFKKWGKNTAILSGDALLVKAYEYISRCGKAILPVVLDAFSGAAAKVCEGQQLDMEFEKKSNVTIREYTGMISLKTAELIAASMKIGAITGGASPKSADDLFEAGKNLGIAFQLQDDLLDVFSDSKTFGKQSGGDILSNKKTFLYIKAMETAGKITRERLARFYRTFPSSPKERRKKVKTIKNIFSELRINVSAIEHINLYYKKAVSLLNQIPAGVNSKETLNYFVLSLLGRNK